MSDLIAFLNARLDEREQRAKGNPAEGRVWSRALRQVEAERAIVGRCADAIRDQGIWGEDGQAALAEDVLRYLAAAYSAP